MHTPILIALVLAAASLVRGELERGYYDLQVRGTLGAAALRRLQRILGYEPKDFMPPNGLRVWIDSPERGAAVLENMPALRSLTPIVRERRESRVAEAINTLRTQYRRGAPLRANNTALQHEGREIGALGFLASSFEYDGGADGVGALTVRLRVSAFNVTNVAELLTAAQSACRTKVRQQEAYGNEFLLSGVHCDDAARVAKELLNDERVGAVELQVPFHTHNQWTIGTTQSRALLSSPPLGLDGRGQILAISDTGVQTGTCFFVDPRGTRVPTTTTQSVPPDTQHRKIRAYWSGTGGDFQDTGSVALGAGHGTHVAGTAVGAVHDSTATRTAQFNGGAPAARLAVVDLLHTNQVGGFLAIPLDIGDTLLRWSSSVGAHIHSGSWGGDANGRYTADEQAVDLYTYKNRDMLVLFAAGNDGPRAESVSSPSVAKNCLSIGSTMNGIDSVSLAQVPSRARDDYTPEWVSSFSGRGSRALPVRKPDLMAPGGPFVWSAAADAAPGGSCASFVDNTVALAGTSMATPSAAATAVLLRQYFVERRYRNALNISVDNTDNPSASLLRAMLVASAQPLLGTYPRQPFKTAQERIDASGHGRIALGAVVESSAVQLVVLANENEQLGLGKQRTWRWCAEVVDDKTGAPLAAGIDYGQVVVALSYADYPTTPGASTVLVNDLRLSVLDWHTKQEMKINEQDGPERRSTNERTVVESARFTIAVTADLLGFGDQQTFSLVAVLQRGPAAANAVLMVTREPSATEQCQFCETTSSFGFENDCATCGNGVVETPLEQCDSSVCCDTARCVELNDRSQCTVMAGDCRLRGRCVDGSCQVNDADRYGSVSKVGLCELLPPSTTLPQCVQHDATWWRQQLRASAEWRQLIDRNQWTLCCAPLWAAMEQIEFELLFAQLTREYIAGTLNILQPGAASAPAFLIAVEQARALLEEQCGIGFVSAADRAEASALLVTLRATNERCAARTNTTGNTSCVAGASDIQQLNKQLCSASGVYDRVTGTCVCHSNRQSDEPNCAHLACSGNGASVFDFDTNKDVCVCFAGWAGVACSQCAAPPDARLVWHCVGLPLVLRSAGARAGSVPVLVDRNSVGSRLSGRFYGAQQKLADGQPGVGELDCWCRTAAERIDWRAYDNHADVLRAALAQRQALDALVAHASAILSGQQLSSSGAVLSSAAISLSVHSLVYFVTSLAL